MPITTPIATSCTIPLRTGFQPISNRWLSSATEPAVTSAPDDPRIAKLILALAALALSAAVLIGAVVGGEDEVAPQASRATAARARPAGKPVVLAFGGDVHFESTIGAELRSSPSLVLASIAPVLRQADVAVVNLETAVTTGGAPTAKTFVFRSPPNALAALAAGGVDVASMANNHGMDYGEAGLRDSLAAAKQCRFPIIGIGLNDEPGVPALSRDRARSADRRDRCDASAGRRAHLRLDGRAGQPRARVGKGRAPAGAAVRQAPANSDTVVVFLHWGVEPTCPSQPAHPRAAARGGRRRRRGRGPRPPSPGRGAARKRARRLRARQLRLVRDERALDADGRPARDDRRSPRPRLPLGARADRGSNPAPARRSGASPRRSRRGRRCAPAPACAGSAQGRGRQARQRRHLHGIGRIRDVRRRKGLLGHELGDHTGVRQRQRSPETVSRPPGRP